jgi:hypothetical protein
MDEDWKTKAKARMKWRNEETGITVIKHKGLRYVVKNRYGSSTYHLKGMSVGDRNKWRRRALEGF